MNTTLFARIATLTLGLLVAASALPVGSAGVGSFNPGPCEKPGKDSVLYETDYYTIPTDGYSWSQYGANPQLHGSSGNGTVWAYNYDAAGHCVGGASAETGSGPASHCPPPGETYPWLYGAQIYRPDGTHWENGDLYLDGYYDTYYFGGQNNQFADKCYGTAYMLVVSQPTETCLTCRMVEGGSEDSGLLVLP